MILIAGGTGTLDRHLVPVLTDQGHAVRILARHTAGAVASSEGRAEFVCGDVRDPAALSGALEGVDVVVSAVTGFGGPDALGTRVVDRDGNLRLIDAARSTGVGHFVLVSVNGASPDHPMELGRDKWVAENALRASGLPWTIVRPTVYLETWLGIVGGPLVASGRTRIFGRGLNPINFVAAADVARFVDLALRDPGLHSTSIEAPGPENLTLDQLAGVVESITGQTGTKQHMSPRVLRLMAVALRPLKPILAAQIAAAVVMDTEYMSVDGPAVRSAFPAIPMSTAHEVAARMFGTREEALGWS